MYLVNYVIVFGKFYKGRGVNTAIVKSMKIHILHNNQLSQEHLKSLRKRIKLILQHLSIPKRTDICISFTDDKRMRELNRTYRGMDKTTDVLSFPQDVTSTTADLNAAIAPANKNHHLILGDIFISVDTARKHSATYKQSIEEEIHRLLVHGILHLLGYDHKKKNDTLLMRAKERQLLSLIKSC
jgi:probable rRNA maturation factor